MSVLSEWDVVKELGVGILIYPFWGIKQSLSGGCLRLTASEQVYVVDRNFPASRKPKKLSVTDGCFTIKSGQTALVWTNESVILSGNFCGSIHSKVNLAASGIGHIGTRVNPHWQGVLSIALHNYSNEEIKLHQGDTIAYLMFHKMISTSPGNYEAPRKRASAKLDEAFPEGISAPKELRKWVEDSWRDGYKESFFKELERKRIEDKVNLTSYQEVKMEFLRRNPLFFWLPRYSRLPWIQIVRLLPLLKIGTIIGILLSPTLYLYNKLLNFICYCSTIN
jgi:deoxycytidine triphosphate deaminase